VPGVGNPSYRDNGQCHLGGMQCVVQDDQGSGLPIRYINLEIASTNSIKGSLIGSGDQPGWDCAIIHELLGKG
jgi:hypothetical protein